MRNSTANGGRTAAFNAAWRALRAHRTAHKNISLMQLFDEDPRRFARFSLQMDDLLLDFSKTTVSAETAKLLIRLAEESGIADRRNKMFAGEIINESEQRPAAHVALRANNGEIVAARTKMLQFAEECRAGKIAAADGAKFTDIVNIGIGGSHLGPAMAAAALHPYCGGLRPHFISNMDGANAADILATLDARRTLILVSSKTFTTAETIENATRAKKWLAAAVGKPAAAKQILAATAAPMRAKKFGAGQIFAYSDSVGGRYSLWGAVGLPLALAIGKKNFLAFLEGARAMDIHFAKTPLRKNLPVMLALTGVWHRNFCGYATRAVLPYDWRLRFLPAYLQQLDMESNGKNVLQNGEQMRDKTAPVVWGSPGTDAQHAYFQFLHQGTDIAPCEFIVATHGHENRAQHKLLFANCIAQAAALMRGEKSESPQQKLAGGRPSITIMYRKLTPYSLGRLLALFEHRAFAEGVLWGVNSFDQWGVELGKVFARRLHPAVASSKYRADEDASTRGLLAHYHQMHRLR